MLLCLDAIGWTAIFTLLLVIVTGALVVVTWKLWTSAQSQLEGQQRAMGILHKSFITITSVNIEVSEMGNFDKKSTMVITLKNVGDGAALNVHARGHSSIGGADFFDYDENKAYLGKGETMKLSLGTDGNPRNVSQDEFGAIINVSFDDFESKHKLVVLWVSGTENGWVMGINSGAIEKIESHKSPKTGI